MTARIQNLQLHRNLHAMHSVVVLLAILSEVFEVFQIVVFGVLLEVLLDFLLFVII